MCLSSFRLISLIAFAGLIQALFAQQCGIRYFSGQSRIVGGTDAVAGEWPWQAQVLEYGMHICGATIIDKEWALTAAHCVEPSQQPTYQIAAGHITEKDPSRVEIGVQKIIVHPSYEREYLHYDLALVKIYGSFTFNNYIQPACLPRDENQFKYSATGYQDCWTSGWGSRWTGSLPADTLKQIPQGIVMDDYCDWIYHKYIRKIQMCTGRQGGPTTDTGICQGDSGGPLHCRDSKTGPWYLAGVASFVWPSCGVTYDGYARVGTFTKWIQDTMKAN